MKIIRLLLKSLATLLLLLVLLLSSFYLFAPVYDFPEPKPFSGNSFYNPYEGMVDTLWRKGNFHAHTSAWSGVTNGQNTIAETEQAYRTLNYDIHPLSNYQSHTLGQTTNEGQPLHFPLYEQGWGITKFHFLVMGDYPIQWRNFVFFTTLSQKQALIEQMNRHSDFFCLNHLAHVRGMKEEQMKYLSGYPTIEAVSGMANSLRFWDSALSSGHPVFGMANDDSHGVPSVGRFATIVNAPDCNYSNIVKALNRGMNYSIEYPDSMMHQFSHKQQVHASYPRLKNCAYLADTLRIALDTPVRQALFIGQNGDTLSIDSLKQELRYVPTPSDTYVRTELLFDNGIKLFLNPIIRTDESRLSEFPLRSFPPISWSLTILYNLLALGVWLALAYSLFRMWKR